MFGFSRFEIVGAVAALVALVAVPWALMAEGRSRLLAQDAAQLQRRIDDPVTGYVAQLERCAGSRRLLEGEVAHQNEAIAAWRAESDRLRAEGAAALARAQASVRAAERDAGRILAAQPRPGEERCDAADRLILETVR
jgi:Co/Zn/Cd efflux system component